MKSFLSSIEQSSVKTCFLPGTKDFLLITSLVFLILCLYLTSIAFNWEFYFFLISFCTIVFVLALFRFDLAFLVVPITLTNPYTLSQTGTNLHISELVLLILFSVWIIRMVMSGERAVFPKQFLFPSLAIIAAALISLLVAHYFIAGLQQVVRYIEILIIFFMITIQYSRSEDKIRRIFLLLIIGGLIASLIGLGQFVTGTLTKGVTRRVFGWHGGGYGALIASTLLLSISALLYQRHRVIKIWAIITIPFAGLALIVSQTRAWIGAFILVIGLMLFWTKRHIIKKILLMVILVITIVAIVIQTNAFGLIDNHYFEAAIDTAFRFGFASGKRSNDNLSLLLRLNVWRVAIIQYLDHPFTGIGVGNLRISDYFSARFSKPAEGAGYIDNQYIQFFAEAGTIAGIAWILYVFQALRSGIRNIKRSIGSNLYAPAIGFFSCLLIFVIGGFFWVITPQHELFALMSLYVGLLFNIGEITKCNTDVDNVAQNHGI
jgi:O-antigen ligase